MQIIYFNKGFYTLLFLFCFFFNEVNAQFKNPQIKLKHYTTEDGLSHDGVLRITQDKEGFLWFGTWDGINRFDGSNFIIYKARPGDSSSLKNNKIRTLIEDSLGYLWIKTYDRKVYRFDKKSENFLSLNDNKSKKAFEDYFINEIVPLKSGDTWFLTENGKALYVVGSGQENIIDVIDFSNSQPLLKDRKILDIYEDLETRLWLATDKGILCYKKMGETYQPFFKNNLLFGGSSFNKILEAKESLFFTSNKGQLLEYDKADSCFLTRETHLNTNINDILISKAGAIYLTTTTGLFIYDKTSKSLKKTFFNGFNSYNSIYEDKSGNIWLEPNNEGIVRYSPSLNKFYFYNQKKDENLPYIIKERFVQDGIYKILEDINGYVWISMKGGGFGFYNPITDQIDYFNNEPNDVDQQMSNMVVNMYSDNKGILWISTRKGGVDKVVFSGNKFEHQILDENNTNRYNNEVRAIYQDRDQKIWIATKIGSLYVYKDDILLKNILDSDGEIGTVYAIKEDRKGNVWIGTKGQGLIKAVPTNKEKTKYKIDRFLNDPQDLESISNNQIYSIIEDDKGRIWVGTFGGGLNLVKYTDSEVKFVNINNSLDQYPDNNFNAIRHLAVGADDNIWIATTDGLLRFNPEEPLDKVKFKRSIKLLGDIESLGNNDVQFIYVSKSKETWIGTFGGGLNKLKSSSNNSDKLRFKVYTKEDGLPSDIILGIVEDDSHHLWLSTENGLSRLDVKEEKFRNYDSYDGLPRSGFSEAACFNNQKGELFFGCINGYVHFNPHKVENTKFKANMVFTDFQVYNKYINLTDKNSPLKYSINHTDTLILDYDQNFISISYAILDYRAVHNISYSYILEGFDKDWHHVKNQKKASYTKLPPGNYNFKVKSNDSNYFNNNPERTLFIKINPPFWKTWWAYCFYIGLLAVCIFFFRKYEMLMLTLKNKVTVEQKLTELKLQFFTNISHELRTPLTLIINPLDKITTSEKLTEKGQQYLNIVNKNTRRMVRFINQLLDFRKIQNQSLSLNISEINLGEFLKDMTSYFYDFAQEKNIKIVIETNGEIKLWADEDKMDIVFYNLISNALKFSLKDTIVTITIISLDEKIIIKIIDEGTGVNEEALQEIFNLYFEGEKKADQALKGTGIGLALSKEIILAHKGEIYANNNKTRGMTFTVELLKGKDHYDAKTLVKAIDYGIAVESTPFSSPDYVALSAKKDDLPKLLVVEDNADLRRIIIDQFEEDYEVIEAENGKEGYEKANLHLPDIVISDVMMPVMDGIELLTKLKNEFKTSHIPVVLLTARIAIEDQIQGLSYGADFYVTKPFHSDYIKFLIDNLLNQRRKLVDRIIDKSKLLNPEPSEILITSKDEIFLKDTIKVIEEGMSDLQFNIDSFASSIGMGRTTFYKKLKSLTNMSPVEFVRDIRLKRSKQLLDTGELTISETAYRVGFNSSSYFSTCFKEKYKVSPSDYMKNNLKKLVHNKL